MTDNLVLLSKGEELSASFPIDPECTLRGDAGDRLVAHLLGLMADREVRTRRLTRRAAEQRRVTVSSLLANLAVAWLNRFRPEQYVAVPFQRSAYSKLGLSCDAMALARNAMLAADLIDHQGGFRDPMYMGFIEVGRLTRIRASAALRDLFRELGISRSSVRRCRSKSLIRLKSPSRTSGPEPTDVTDSRSILVRINSRFDNHDIDLPDCSWKRLEAKAASYQNSSARNDDDPPYVGDPTAKALYRVFTREWFNGGRLYGAWWLGIPADERRHLTIDGIPTVEIDFGNMHPALLYWVRGKVLTIDPYGLPPYSRELCKETFQRLINGSFRKGGASLRLPKDHAPPIGCSFEKFISDYKQHLHEVSDCFGKDIGLILQKADSDIALSILDTMDRTGIVVLPVHDSFIVQEHYKDALYSTMEEIFRGVTATKPTLKVSQTPPAPPPLPLLEPVRVPGSLG